MPAISLVVCLYRERDLLARLVEESQGVFDDLVVVHDGPENAAPEQPREPALAVDFAFTKTGARAYRTPPAPTPAGSIQALVESCGGRYFEGPRSFQQEPHWPFAWAQARQDWILRLDADEFPSAELKRWLCRFREGDAPAESVSGFTCIWPLWDGACAVSKRWPAGRPFLFDRRRVRFFGMVEHSPVPDGRFEPVALTLEHRPKRKSYGLRNILVRRQAYAWRSVIARSLLGSPRDLPRWRCDGGEWPDFWERLRRHPLRAGLYYLLRNSLATLRSQWRDERRMMIGAALSGPCHHLLIGLRLWALRRQRRDRPDKTETPAQTQ